ncbi:ribosomal-protein-alanine acetyltransferase [Providencia rustigianii]|uniref:Ribosomal-protein-alanine acetyltransferase n=1 Tax=Providencia rustigianii TaxID=158850 RepID=A0A379G3T0_9GAMM|nr:GNAT family N-acetyltransferase [Providencia rustigianii]SUC35561.1 ribosomal-protein-alanine acetyltransferase [Providencia rustigianii]
MNFSDHTAITYNEKKFYTLEHHFWSAICLSTYDITPTTVAYFSELNMPIFNYIYLHSGATTASFEVANDLFKQQSKPYVLVVHSAELAKFSALIQEYQLVNDGESTAMVLEQQDLIKQAPCCLPDFYHIEQCNQNLSCWAEPLVTAFPVDSDVEVKDEESVIDQYIRYHQRALDKNINMLHFVLFHHQRPVTSLTLTIYKDLARLDDIGTDIEYQRKGLATMLIKHALHICHQHDIKRCYLEASSDGLSVYSKLGFKPIFNYYSYISE